MNLKVNRLSYVRPQGDHRRVETLEMSDLQDSVAFFSRADHAISFFERARDWFLHQHVNARFEQTAGDLAVHFRWDCEAHCVHPADQLAPVGGPLGVSFLADAARRFFVEIADGDKLRWSFNGQGAVNAGVLSTKTADADDCCT